MGSTQIPADAPWAELATASPTSGSAISFTSLPPYKNYRIQWSGLTQTGSGTYSVRFNNDSALNYAYDIGSRSQSATNIDVTQAYQLQMTIEGANEISKRIYGFSGASAAGVLNAVWTNQSVINEVNIIANSGATFAAGTIKIYGRN